MAGVSYGPRANPLQAGMTAATASQGPAYVAPKMTTGISAKAVQPGQLSFLTNPQARATNQQAFRGASTLPAGLNPQGAGGFIGGAGGGGGAGFDMTAFSSVAPNPYQTQAYNSMADFLKGLPNATDQYATDALARQRDLNAASLADVRGQAGGRGFGIDSGVSQRLQGKAAQAGNANLATMGSELANAGRAQTLTGLQGQGTLGTGIANAQTSQQNALTGFYAAQAQAQLAAWTAQNAAQQQQWQNMYQVYNNPMYQANYAR